MAGKLKDLEALFDTRRDEQRHGTRGERERERPSWRELDRRKDRSNHGETAGDVEPRDRYQDVAAQKALKAQLGALFEDKEAAALRQAILAADRASLGVAVAAWVDAKGVFPADDPELLVKALDTRKAAHLLLVVEAVAEHLLTTDPVRRAMFLLKLRGKSRTIFDKKVSARIRQILASEGAEG